MNDREAAGEPPLIVTVEFDAATFTRLDALRQAHFPAALNHLQAHLTLFHHLPGAREGDVLGELARAARRAPIPVTIAGPRSLGRGVALAIEAPELLPVRAQIADAFRGDLTRQDGQGFRPHVTIQNKVDAQSARALLHRLSAEFAPWSGVATGLLLWRYLGGPWQLVSRVPFQA